MYTKPVYDAPPVLRAWGAGGGAPPVNTAKAAARVAAERDYWSAAAREAAYERDLSRAKHRKADAWNHYLAGACVALLLTLLYVASSAPMPAPLSCPNSREVMNLSPTEIRATRSDVAWL